MYQALFFYGDIFLVFFSILGHVEPFSALPSIFFCAMPGSYTAEQTKYMAGQQKASP